MKLLERKIERGRERGRLCLSFCPSFCPSFCVCVCVCGKFVPSALKVTKGCEVSSVCQHSGSAFAHIKESDAVNLHLSSAFFSPLSLFCCCCCCCWCALVPLVCVLL
jgi:hypothetical protein